MLVPTVCLPWCHVKMAISCKMIQQACQVYFPSCILESIADTSWCTSTDLSAQVSCGLFFQTRISAHRRHLSCMSPKASLACGSHEWRLRRLCFWLVSLLLQRSKGGHAYAQALIDCDATCYHSSTAGLEYSAMGPAMLFTVKTCSLSHTHKDNCTIRCVLLDLADPMHRTATLTSLTHLAWCFHLLNLHNREALLPHLLRCDPQCCWPWRKCPGQSQRGLEFPEELQSFGSRTYPFGPDPLRTPFPGPDSDLIFTWFWPDSDPKSAFERPNQVKIRSKLGPHQVWVRGSDGVGLCSSSESPDNGLLRDQD